MQNRFILVVSALVMSVGTMLGATAAKGVFTVAEGKTVQFANGTETGLYKWADALALANTAGSGWTMLTGAEWSYLLALGRTEAADKNALGKVNGKKGLIILPDDWAQPAGVPVYRTVDEAGVGYGNNVYTTEQWSVMADAGAVFLPCGGYGYDDGQGGVTIENEEDHGAYWSIDEYDETQAYCMRFNETDIHDLNHQVKTVYYSVVLVRETPAPVEEIILDEEDEWAAYKDKWTAAKANSFAYVRRTLKKDGTFYTLCLPFDVPDIDDSPLAGAEVFTFDGGTVSGSTGNEVLNLEMTRYTDKRLYQGVPYILRWSNTGETLATPLCFENVENWDDDTDAGADPGNETIKYHGVYPKAHIPGYPTGEEAHYNFFMGANNTLYWPDDTLYPDSKMKGFRAYFYITSGSVPSSVQARRSMKAVWKVSEGLGAATGVESVLPTKVSVQKLMRDGRVIIVIDGEQYTIGGQRL